MALTRRGAGLFDLDSFSYLSSAHNLATGHGLSYPVSPTRNRPLLNFAPLFPILLAGLELLGFPGQVAVRWLNAVLYAANLVLFALVIFQATKSIRLAALSAVLFLLSAELLVAHAWALSEPLLIALSLGSLYAFLRWQQGDHSWFWAMCCCVALAVATKFVALALIPVYIVFIMLRKPGTGNKLTLSATVMASGLIPFIVLSLRSYWLSKSFHGFSFEFVPLQTGNIDSAVQTLSTWFFPENGYARWTALYAGAFFLLVVMMAVFLVRRIRKAGGRTLSGSNLWWIVVGGLSRRGRHS